MSDSEDIVQFGVMYEGENPIEYVTVKDTDKTERKLDSNGDIMYDPKDGMPVITKYVTKTREMTATERSALEAKIPNFSELMTDITVEKQSDDNKVSIDNRLDESLNNIGEQIRERR